MLMETLWSTSSQRSGRQHVSLLDSSFCLCTLIFDPRLGAPARPQTVHSEPGPSSAILTLRTKTKEPVAVSPTHTLSHTFWHVYTPNRAGTELLRKSPVSRRPSSSPGCHTDVFSIISFPTGGEDDEHAGPPRGPAWPACHAPTRPGVMMSWREYGDVNHRPRLCQHTWTSIREVFIKLF